MAGEKKQQSRKDIWQAVAMLVASTLVLAIVVAQPVLAQTYAVIHNFAGSDGRYPTTGLTTDRAGNLYGTTSGGGTLGGGTVFKLTRQGSGWLLHPLYNFTGGNDGAGPDAKVIFGPDGSLYGTTASGGVYGVGTIYKLQPPASACKTAICPWTETVLYSFTGLADGANPQGDMAFDSAGNLYGATFGGAGGGCYSGCGVVYQLTPSHGGWSLNVLHSFTGLSDGGSPEDGVILDSSGNIYGTTVAGGGYFFGTVFELTQSGGGWTENVLHNFQGGSDGKNPEAGLVFDPQGNLYGVTVIGGSHNNGIAFELQPANGGWNYSLLYNIGLQSGEPASTPILDNSGNLYGTAVSGGSHNAGAVYELTHANGSWNYIGWHDFTISDGEYPVGSVTFDAQGNLYGTAMYGGASQQGVVFEITP